jgi:hypothetical protein
MIDKYKQAFTEEAREILLELESALLERAVAHSAKVAGARPVGKCSQAISSRHLSRSQLEFHFAKNSRRQGLQVSHILRSESFSISVIQ